MNADLYARIVGELGSAIAGAFDTKFPDSYALSTPAVVVSGISDIPLGTIDGRIALRDQRVTVEVQALNLITGRAVKESLITALHGWKDGTVKACALEDGGPELYDSDMNPPRYILPVDFLITL